MKYVQWRRSVVFIVNFAHMLASKATRTTSLTLLLLECVHDLFRTATINY